jgi:hypothetical protein
MVRARTRVRWLALPAAAAIALALLALVSGRGGDEPPEFGRGTLDEGAADPFAWSGAREDEFVARATAGHSHILYAKSPGGVVATAERVERWRDRVESAADEAGVDPELVEGMVFLESAGLPDAMASDDLEGAVGLTQILAETGTSLLGMRVDVRASERLTKRIRRAQAEGLTGRARRLRAERRRVDERFDPGKALAATGRYLALARERFGRDDMAVVSYHMGMGNLEDVLAAYGEEDPSYARVFFDATPHRHPRTFRRLSGLGDDSSTYLWRVFAAAEIMRLHRDDPEELVRLASLHANKNSAEEVLHPEANTEVFDDAEELEEAYADGTLRPFPDRPRALGLKRARQMGELAKEDRRLYRGLRPEAFALAVYLAAGVQEISGADAPLIVTSTVRDREYQRELVRRTIQATSAYSLHTTGWAFDVRRRYVSRAQAVAFQAMLDRLESLNMIAWVREPGAIHITASAEAAKLLPLID